MKAIINFISERGFTFMLCGMFTAITGSIAYVFFNSPRYAGTPFPKAAIVLAIIGFATYFIGRVSLAMQRRRNRRKPAGEAEDAL